MDKDIDIDMNTDIDSRAQAALVKVMLQIISTLQLPFVRILWPFFYGA